jgi:cellulose synthase (UDP-forming)
MDDRWRARDVAIHASRTREAGSAVIPAPPASAAAAGTRPLWRRRTAADVTRARRAALVVLVSAGLASVVLLADWWFRRAHVGDPVLFAALSLAFWYGIGRMVLGWINVVAVAKPAPRTPPSGLRVAIFTTSAPGEPPAMFERTLAACARVRYPHTTYLLDDTGDPRFREAAARHGAVWLELAGLPGAKAGKINRALELTREEFILVLDPDHVPFPEFLDRVLGHFDDPRVAFVQVAQAYYNQRRSFTAAGAAEQTYAFYGPGQMGLYGHGANVAIGANCTFRRLALDSIGGHGIGLAEDLITAIRLHGAGWRSVYVPEIVSRGLVPEDLQSFLRQQLKWSRGVYEVLFAELPSLLRSLRWRQRLSYLTIGTYYLCGVTSLVYLVFPYLYLWTGIQPAHMALEGFLTALGPVAALGLTIYVASQRWLCDAATERGLHWRGLVLKLACWPVYLQGTLLAVMRADVPYVPTAKQPARVYSLHIVWPQLTLLGLYAVTLAHTIRVRLLTVDPPLDFPAEAVWGMIAFATLPVVAGCGAIYAAWQSRRPPGGNAWDDVDVDGLGGDA